MENNLCNRLFVDMDGTLAKFQQVASLDTLYEPGYFAKLAPQQNVVDAIRLLQGSVSATFNIYVLSSVLSDSPYALAEKNQWLNQHLPEIDPAHRIFVPYGNNKANHLPSGIHEHDYLLDDYTKNLDAWSLAGGQGVKLLNDINHTRRSWQGSMVSYDHTPEQLAHDLLAIMRGELVQDLKPLPEEEKNFMAMIEAGYDFIHADGFSSNFLMWQQRDNGRIIGLDGWWGVRDFLKEIHRVNEGYEIKRSIQVGDCEYVLGQNLANSADFVTWKCTDKTYYFWGHYFSDEKAAFRDLLQRSLDDRQLQLLTSEQIDAEAARAMNDHEAEFGADGWRAFRAPGECELQ